MNRCFAAMAILLTGTLFANENEVNPAEPSARHGWLEDFRTVQAADDTGAELPEFWKLEGLKLGVPATFSTVVKGENGKNVLQVTCNQSTGGIICDTEKPPQIDLTKTPVMRWRWRVVKYPNGADGRVAEKDDQPIAIYLGINGFMTKNSLAYRWEGITPVGFEGSNRYGGGIVKVKYIVMRNEKTPAGEWVTETRNVAEDFKRLYGGVPEEFAVSVMANSQYTKSNSVAEIAFIEFLPAK